MCMYVCVCVCVGVFVCVIFIRWSRAVHTYMYGIPSFVLWRTNSILQRSAIATGAPSLPSLDRQCFAAQPVFPLLFFFELSGNTAAAWGEIGAEGCHGKKLQQQHDKTRWKTYYTSPARREEMVTLTQNTATKRIANNCEEG